MSALGGLPACTVPTPQPAESATIEDHAHARARGLLIVDPGEGLGALHAFPPLSREVELASALLGCPCRAVILANWAAGERVHRWFAVEVIGLQVLQ